MSLPAPSKDIVLAAAQGLDPESSTSLQAVVTRLAQQGYRICVMPHNGQPSDHKVWWEGIAWTFISSDGYKAGTYRWEPYIQTPYNGTDAISPCGIPASAKQDCPSWATVPANPKPTPPPVPPATLEEIADGVAKLELALEDVKTILTALANTAPPVYRTTALGIPIVLHPDPPA